MNPWLFPTFALMAMAIALEACASVWKGGGLYRWGDTLTNVFIYLGYLAVLAVWGFAAWLLYDFVHGFALFDLTSEGALAHRYWWAPWVLLVILEDFTYYLFHRASHRWGFLWASHQVHHSSRLFNLSTALRQTWAPFLATPFWLWLPLLGFDPLAVLWVQSMSLLFQFFLHTELIPSYGLADLLFNSPRHHRAHHGRDDAFVDRNFGGVLIVWDRLFGSFTALRPESYGLPGTEPTGPFSAQFHPWLELFRGRRSDTTSKELSS